MTVDEQLTRFVDMIQKVYINFPLLQAMRVPTYARFLKNILTRKRAPNVGGGKAHERM
jgi:hypothetical protein